MKEWYTRKEVAELLGVSLATVYHYAKQNKIIKIEDPHRLFRETRYEKKEVDELVEERRKNTPTGWRPSELAKELNVPVQRIYTLIRETHLQVDQLQSGDERMIYSIPEETAAWIRQQIENTSKSRASRAEFYDARHDIALFQLFKDVNGQEMRVIRNEALEWGFKLPSGTWIPYTDGRDIFKYEAVYPIHRENEKVTGYTDFILQLNDPDSYLFIDFIYKNFGIENIRLRLQGQVIYASIKSGSREITDQIPIDLEKLTSFIQAGDYIIEGSRLTLLSGYRRTTFDLPVKLLEQLQNLSKEEGMTMSEFVEHAVRDKIKRDDELMKD